MPFVLSFNLSPFSDSGTPLRLTRAAFGVAELSAEDGALHVARHGVPPLVLEAHHWLRANRALGTGCE